MVTCRQLHYVTEVSDVCLDASVELRDFSASGGENMLEDNKACFLALVPNYRVHTLVRVLGSPRLRRSTCDRRVYTSLTCFATPGDNGVPTFTRLGPGSCPMASVLSYIHLMGSRLLPVAIAFYIHPMGSRLLPGGECLLHSPDGVPAPARWRVSCPTFTRWGPGSCPVAIA